MKKMKKMGIGVDGFYYGKDKFMPHGLSWVFDRVEWDRMELIRTRFASVIHSGLKKQAQALDSPIRKPADTGGYKILDTGSALIISILVIWVLALVITCIIFLAEMYAPNFTAWM
jgi:hypothetical protein